MKKITIILLIVSFLCHSTIYPGVERNETCYNPEPAKIYSWHYHVLYWQTNEEHSKGAYVIRDKFIAEFKDKLGPDCTDLFHQDHLCMFEPERQPDGPFLTAQWAVFIPNENFAEVVPWILQHRGNYDVLVHPNSGCELEDHSWWAMWGGKPWDINLDAMSHDRPFPWDVEAKSTKSLLERKDTSPLIKQFLTEHDHK